MSALFRLLPLVGLFRLRPRLVRVPVRVLHVERRLVLPKQQHRNPRVLDARVLSRLDVDAQNLLCRSSYY